MLVCIGASSIHFLDCRNVIKLTHYDSPNRYKGHKVCCATFADAEVTHFMEKLTERIKRLVSDEFTAFLCAVFLLWFKLNQNF